MCLGELVQVREIRPDGRALAQGGPQGDGREVEISLLLLDEPVLPGDWLLVHSGIALSLVDEDDARTALALRSELATGSPTTPPTTRTGGPT